MTAGESWPYGCPFYGIRYEEAMMSIRDVETDGFSAMDAFLWRNAVGWRTRLWMDEVMHKSPQGR